MMVQTIPAIRSSTYPWLERSDPDCWEAKRLKYCAQLVNEKVDGRESKLPYTGLEHIESWTGKRILPNGGGGSDGQANRFCCGDVLFGKLRPYLAKVLHASEDGICTGELLVLRPRASLQEFLFYFMLAPDFIHVVDASTYGAKMPRASWDFIGNLPVLVPTQDEQRAIAAFLDRETARIDSLVQKKERQIQLLREKRAALISHAVTKGLDPNVKMKDSGVEWLGEIPEHWEVFAVRRAAKRIQTGSTPPTAQGHYYQGGNVPWYGPGSFGFDLGLSEPVKLVAQEAVRDGVARLFCRDSAMIVTIGATIGKVGYVDHDASCNQQITVVTFDRWKAVGKFAAYQLKRLEPILQGIAPTTTLPILNQQQVGDLPIALPSLEEQEVIVAHIDAAVQKVDLLVHKIQESITLLREYRTALISAAVTGKIDVRHMRTQS